MSLAQDLCDNSVFRFGTHRKFQQTSKGELFELEFRTALGVRSVHVKGMAWKAMQKSWLARPLSVAHIQVMHVFEGGFKSIYEHYLRGRGKITNILLWVSNSAPNGCNDIALVKLSQTQWDILQYSVFAGLQLLHYLLEWQLRRTKPGESWNAMTVISLHWWLSHLVN